MNIRIEKNRNMTGLKDKLCVNFENNATLLFTTFLSDTDEKWKSDIICDTLNRKLDFLMSLAFQIYELKSKKENRGYITSISSIWNIEDVKKILKYIKKRTPYLNNFKIEKFPFTYDENARLHLVYELPLEYVQQFETLGDFFKLNRITIDNFLYNPFVSLILF